MKEQRKKIIPIKPAFGIAQCLWTERPFAFYSVVLLHKCINHDSLRIRWLYLREVTEGNRTKGISTQMRTAGRKLQNHHSEEKGERHYQHLEIGIAQLESWPLFNKQTGRISSHLAGRKATESQPSVSALLPMCCWCLLPLMDSSYPGKREARMMPCLCSIRGLGHRVKRRGI